MSSLWALFKVILGLIILVPLVLIAFAINPVGAWAFVIIVGVVLIITVVYFIAKGKDGKSDDDDDDDNLKLNL